MKMTNSKRRVVHLSTRRAIVGLALVLVMLLVVPVTASAQPPSWVPPEIVIVADDSDIQVGDPVQLTITVTNPSPTDGGIWYNMRLTIPIDPALRIDSASSTMGTVSIIGQTAMGTVSIAGPAVVVNGGITLAPHEFFVVTINCTSVGPGPKTVIIPATLEYADEEGNPQDPLSEEQPVVIEIEEEVPPIIPEASTLVLLGSAATGLAGYVGLQIQARRRNGR